MNDGKNIAVIGSGFSGLASATLLAQHGFDVTIYEKNNQVGGRARVLSDSGYTFDMGPSWYWMPDVFEKYFSNFNKKVKHFYELKLLSPSFRVYFGKNDFIDVPSSPAEIAELFAQLEPGGADKFKKFISDAETKYKIGMQQLVYSPSISILEFASLSLLNQVMNISVLRSLHSDVKKYFSNPRALALLEFPVLFLGATAEKIPSLYSLMDFAAYELGTWYPVGGFSKISGGMMDLAESFGVKVQTGEAIEKLEVSGNRISLLRTRKEEITADAVIGAADYAHTEQLLDEEFRNYSGDYWKKKTFAPSALIFFLGVKKKISGLIHHNLFFDESLKEHAEEIYENPQWPRKPLFYVCCTSKTDDTVAPEGHENLFVLIPIATGLKDDESVREKYFQLIINRLEENTGEEILSHIEFKKSYSINDFTSDYNSYGGNAYGLANTLRQTAFMRPKIINRKVENLFYCGQLTVPGPGVPPALISGQIAAQQVINYFKKQKRK